MGKKSYSDRRQGLRMDDLVQALSQAWGSLPDARNRVINQTMGDVAMSAYAMFALKYPSLLQFDTQTQVEHDNLQRVFGIEQVCSDTQMRHLLDQVDANIFRRQLGQYWKRLDELGILRDYRIKNRYLMVSIDGVEHFRSTCVKCDQCLTRQSSNGQISYSHSMLCAALMHPDQREVFTLAAEPIVQQDGQTKNDCELRAVDRLLHSLSTNYPEHDLLVVEDALYANGPHLSRLAELDYAFVVNVKSTSHASLFRHFETRHAHGTHHSLVRREHGCKQHFRWVNDLSLNNDWPDLRLNMLIFEEQDAKGNTTTFSWVTSLKISKSNVVLIMRIGRSRWKIENETFNTLKNQGYHFEHNYGHGKRHLATVLAYIMLLAFLIDQIVQRCSKPFEQLCKAAKTKAKLWFTLRSVFTVQPCFSFEDIHHKMAELFNIQLE